MVYHYDGEAVKRLISSYKQDKEILISDPKTRFPERGNGFKEIDILKALFFPNYWNTGHLTESRTALTQKLDELGQLFVEGIVPYKPEKDVEDIVTSALDRLPDVRRRLKTDLQRAFENDPAAEDYTQIIRSYPGFFSIEIQRIAHVLYEQGAGSYARELTEHVHSMTGIDIHPGATIGNYFFIDHGTGVVIGETSEIGHHVTLYQGVTLGVLHFEKDGNGILRKGYKRHPTLGNHVVVGAGAKVLGPVNIGNHVNIGANSWIDDDVPSHHTVFVTEHPRLERKKRRK